MVKRRRNWVRDLEISSLADVSYFRFFSRKRDVCVMPSLIV